MSDERDYAHGEMDRRLANAVRFGTIAEIDYAKAMVKVDLGDLVTDWVPWTTPRAGEDQVWTTPDVGEQVVLVSPGDPSQGVVLGSLFQAAHPQNGNAGKDRRITFKDGTVVEFDRDGSVLRIIVNAAGSVLVKIGATELAMQDGQATLKAANISLEGNVTITGGSLTHNGTNVGSTHTHGGVTPGGASTAAPN
jgi:phage baseplate assembly protein V